MVVLLEISMISGNGLTLVRNGSSCNVYKILIQLGKMLIFYDIFIYIVIYYGIFCLIMIFYGDGGTKRFNGVKC